MGLLVYLIRLGVLKVGKARDHLMCLTIVWMFHLFLVWYLCCQPIKVYYNKVYVYGEPGCKC